MLPGILGHGGGRVDGRVGVRQQEPGENLGEIRIGVLGGVKIGFFGAFGVVALDLTPWGASGIAQGHKRLKRSLRGLNPTHFAPAEWV